MFWRRKKKTPDDSEFRAADPRAVDGSDAPSADEELDGEELDLSETLFLARGAQEGDSVAWLDLDSKIRPWLEKMLSRHKLPAGFEAQDVIQEVLLYVHQRFDQFKVQPDAAFRAWVKQILDHKLIDLKRRAAAKKRGSGNEQLIDDCALLEPEGGDADRPSVSLRAREIEEHLTAAQQKLQPKHRQVLELREAKGLSFEEIGQIMGYPNVASVRVLLRRARLALREEMAEFDDDQSAGASS